MSFNKNVSAALFLMTLIMSLTACDKSSTGTSSQPEEEVTRGELLSVSRLASYSTEELNAALQRFTTSIRATYGVDVYKVTYTTASAMGEPINVSGQMVIPAKTPGTPSPRLSYQHGTIFLDEDAPSQSYGALEFPVLAASLGYLVTAADYIGYGESAGLPHPHTHKKTLSAASIDLLRASQRWAQDQNIADNGQLFLMGYSEGGYATYAMQQEIEQNLAGEFSITASVPAASSYDLPLTAQQYLDMPAIDSFIFQAFIISSYDQIYQLSLLNEIVLPAYLDVVSNYFDGSHSYNEINAELPPKGSAPESFYQVDFLENYPQGLAAPLVRRLEENSLNNWTPAAPTRFFQNPDDEVVPYQAVVDMVSDLQQQGADVDLVSCDLGGLATTHGNCFFSAVYFTATYFSGLAQDL